ncbi:MAG: hypothetical protein ACPGUI_00430, partial [Halarcobacter sp.]
MRHFILTIIFIVFGSLYAQEQTEVEKETDKKRNIMKSQNNSVYSKTYQDATGNESTKDWNDKDFHNHFNSQNNMNTGMIGNTQTMLKGITGSKEAFSGNPNSTRSDVMQQNEDYKDEPSIKVWNSDLQDGLIANSTKSGKKNSIAVNQTVKCYITRDIPFRYKCSHTGIIYGGGMNENGLKARTECESECFEQNNCVAVKEELEGQTDSILDGTFTSTDILKEHIINHTMLKEDVKVDYMQLTTSTDIDRSRASITIKYTNWKDQEVYILQRFRITGLDENHRITIQDNVKDIQIMFETPDENETIEFKDIQFSYVRDNRFICSSLQDITMESGDEFSVVCPSGNVATFSINDQTYKICTDYGITGDNVDGTFSTLDACNAICKKKYECSLDTSIYTTDILKTFREGCIAGEADCETDTCESLRINGAMVLNENVFDANSTITKTIINSAQIEGVDRPRILLNEDVEFQKRNAEEWKDGAYKNMVQNNTFGITVNTFNEDTQEDHAYMLGLNSKSTLDGYATIPIRGLFWLYKPKASDINMNYQHKFYAVIEVIAERFIFNEFGKKERTKDKILYVKTNEDDSFKPFAVKEKFAKNVIIENDYDEMMNLTQAEDAAASWKYMSFNKESLSWYVHSSGLTLESFMIKDMALNTPYFTTPIINNVSELIYAFPGLIRRIDTTGPYENKVYAGKFLGTGHSVGRYRVFAFNGRSESFTYSDIVAKIENEELEPIYDNLQRDIYKNRITDDTQKEGNNIDIFTYGPIDKKTGFVNIKPN